MPARSVLAALLTVLAAGTLASSAAGYLPAIEPAPAFELIDQQGRTVNSTDLRGSVVLLAFMYTHCAGACPMVTERMGSIAKRLERAGALGKSLRLVSITFDPVRDTPSWLNTYARALGADPRWWLFLTGPPDQIAALLERYDFHVKAGPSGDFDHVSRVYLIDPVGRIRQIYSISLLDPPRVVRDVNSLLEEQRRANLVQAR